MGRGEKLICSGTTNHVVMWDCRPHGLTGSKIEKVLDLMHITVNKNSVVGDKNMITPGGIRLGTPALTTRGMKEPEMEKIAGFMLKAVEISKKAQEVAGKKLVDFLKHLETGEELKALS